MDFLWSKKVSQSSDEVGSVYSRRGNIRHLVRAVWKVILNVAQRRTWRRWIRFDKK